MQKKVQHIYYTEQKKLGCYCHLGNRGDISLEQDEGGEGGETWIHVRCISEIKLMGFVQGFVGGEEGKGEKG